MDIKDNSPHARECQESAQSGVKVVPDVVEFQTGPAVG